MPSSLSFLLARRDLALKAIVPAETDRPVCRVHVSELEDPTPFLEEGEFLLTTGLRRTEPDPGWDGYIARLAERRAAGLGFGVGPAHGEIPGALVEAARRHGFPLIEVPSSTPFIEISKAVTGAVSKDEQQGLLGAVQAQYNLTRGALSSGGVREVVNRLARALECWILLLDPTGALRCGAPETARKHTARVRMEIDRLYSADPQRSVALTMAGESVAMLPLPVHGRIGGFLVAGRATPLSQVERSVLTTAVGLLSLDLYGRWDLREADRRAHTAVVQLAVSGHCELAVRLAETLAVPFPDPPLRIAVLGAPQEQLPDLLQAAEDHQALRMMSALTAPHEPDMVLVVLAEAEGETTSLEEVLMHVPHSRGAVSDPAPMNELPDAWRRARAVFHASPSSGRLVLAKDLAAAGLLKHLRTPDAAGWAGSLLEPLDRHATRSRLDLVATLHVFLSHNGLVDASASALGIHRHTLRYRLNRIAELLDCDLDNPTVRAELWIALRLREQS